MMFSKAGRSSTSKHQILKEKDFIISKKIRLKKPEKTVYKIKTLPLDEINLKAAKEQVKILRVKPIQKSRKSHVKRSHSGNFIFKVQSRDEFYESFVAFIQNNRDSMPAPGTYNISFSHAEKNKLCPSFKSQIPHIDNFSNTSSYFYPSYTTLPSSISTTAISFNKQPERFKDTKKKLEDKDYSCDDSIIRKHIRFVDMKKGLARKKNLFTPPNTSMIYDANKEFVMKNLKNVPKFEGMSKRKELFNVITTPDPYNVVFTAVHPNEKSFDMSKKPNLIIDTSSPLPTFMQSIHNRTSICFQSLKSIKMRSNLGE